MTGLDDDVWLIEYHISLLTDYEFIRFIDELSEEAISVVYLGHSDVAVLVRCHTHIFWFFIYYVN